MNKRLIGYGRQTIVQEDIERVVQVLQSERLTQGSVVPKFEKELCAKVGATYGTAVNSGTSALHIACLALGLTRNDMLWTSPISFVASANCAQYCGASVDFVDIDPESGLMDVEQLRSKLIESKKQNNLPKILIPVHLGGTSCNMEDIFSLSKEFGFSIIEDASHALGGSYKNYPVGSCKWSDITTFSFHPVKTITTCEGGMAVTNNAKIANLLSLYREHGITKSSDEFLHKPAGPWHYEQHILGYNFRLSDVNAALGLSQLTHLDTFLKRRRALALNYKKLLGDLPISFLIESDDCESAHHLAIILLDSVCAHFQKEIFTDMINAGIGVQLHYQPIHLNPYYLKLGFRAGDWPFSEEYAKAALTLPLYPSLSEADQTHIVNTLSQILGRYYGG